DADPRGLEADPGGLEPGLAVVERIGRADHAVVVGIEIGVAPRDPRRLGLGLRLRLGLRFGLRLRLRLGWPRARRIRDRGVTRGQGGAGTITSSERESED